MSVVVPVMNMKGGVGKTTICAHVGRLLARRKQGGVHKKVLPIDYDPQFNLSHRSFSAPP
jgi:chromosome partitioning protein